jgi:PAS domain S-box-containing protein
MRAWDRKKFLTKTVEFGQGLVGQVALEGQTIFITTVPKDYITITSGLGLANPNCVVIVPLKSEEDLIGIVELASFHQFTESEVKFIEKVSESIASVILSARTSERTKKLLESTSQLTEQLRSQEEEIRQNMEEMQATQEEMARTQRELARNGEELEQKQNSLNALINNTDDSIIAMDRNYKIIIMNDVLRNRYKGTQYEGLDVGADALEALGAVKDEWKLHYDRALDGEKLNFTIRSSVKGEDTYREYFINPMKDGRGTVIGLSVFSRDVTANHNAQIDMQQKGSILDSIINHKSDTYFAIDKSYKIIVVNEVLKNRFRSTNVELKEGDSILDLLPAASLNLWKDRYDRALGGEQQRYEEERQVVEKTLFLEVYVDPIYNKSENIIGCSVVSRDITEKKQLQDEMERLTAEVVSLKK